MRLNSQILSVMLMIPMAGCCRQGSGDVIEETREIKSFEKIRIDVPADLDISNGATDKIEIRTDDNLMGRLDTHVTDDTLIIKWDSKGCFDPTEMEIRVSTPVLSQLKIDGDVDAVLKDPFEADSIAFSMDGSGSVTAEEGLLADEVSVRIDGSGDFNLVLDANTMSTVIDGSGNVHLSGTAETQSIDIDGSGKISAYDLETQSVTINIDGSGTCRVNAQETLDVRIDGSGDVYYTGSPEVTQSIDGSGTVRSAE